MKTTSLLNLFALLAFCGGQVQAQSPAPRLLPFQGRLTDQNGNMVTNGVRLVQFKIYDEPTAGAPRWAGEVHRTTVNGGLVNVLLGTKTPFTGVDFDRTLYLEITVDVNDDNQITAADPPMLPRQVLLPVIFAKEAADSRKLAGQDWTPIFGTNSPNGPIPGTKLAAESISASQITPRTMTSNQIADVQIDSRILADGAVTTAKLAGAAVTAQQIAPDTIVLTNLSAALLRYLNPPGTIAAFAGATNRIPAGWLLCDGRTVSTNQYPELFSAITTNWGAGSPGWFCLPDLRGVFLRGVDGGRGKDTDRLTRTYQAPGGATGDTVGSVQDDLFRLHNHNMIGGFSGSPLSGYSSTWPIAGTYGADNQHWESGGNETRPKNAYVNYIIKY